jgi:hypothetical protein
MRAFLSKGGYLEKYLLHGLRMRLPRPKLESELNCFNHKIVVNSKFNNSICASL